MTDPALEDRLRRSMAAAIADLPIGGLRPAPKEPRPREAAVTVAAVLVAAVVAVAVVVRTGGSSGQTVNVGATPPARLPVPHGMLEPLLRSSEVMNIFIGPARRAVVSTRALRVGDFDFTVQDTRTRNHTIT